MSIYPASVDDNDPSIIYSGSGWELVTQDLDWRGTMHSTSVPGSWARFRFTGSRVVVICTIPTGSGSLSRASFQIDDGPAIPISHVTTPPVQWQTQFWNSGPLPFGSHLLTITNLDNDAYFRMDRIDYDPTDSNAPRTPNPPRTSSSPPPPQQPTTANTPSPDPTSVSSTPLASISQSSRTSTSSIASTDISRSSGSLTGSSTSGSQSSTNSAQSSGFPPATSNSPNSGPIVITGSGNDNSTGSEKSGHGSLSGIIAGVLGGALVVLIIGIILYCLRRRRNRLMRVQASEEFEGRRMTQVMDPSMLLPFAENSSNQSTSASSPHSQTDLLPIHHTTTFDRKSRNPPPWTAVSPIPDGIQSPDTTSDMYTNTYYSASEVRSVTSAEQLPSKASLGVLLDQRLSVANQTEAPPAYNVNK